jgi:hypothetical protein
MYAGRGGHWATVRTLMWAQADSDVHGDFDTYGIPLTIAVIPGYFATVRLLVAAGAEIGLHGGNEQMTAEQRAPGASRDFGVFARSRKEAIFPERALARKNPGRSLPPFHLGHFGGSEPKIHRPNISLHLFGITSADNRPGHGRMTQRPGDGGFPG